MLNVHRTLSVDRLRRVIAAGCATLVLALSIFAASPVAHEWLHVCDDHAAREDGCAVVLFASGVSLPFGPIELPVPATAALENSTVVAAEIFLVSPRYLRQPERGPPVS